MTGEELYERITRILFGSVVFAISQAFVHDHHRPWWVSLLLGVPVALWTIR